MPAGVCHRGRDRAPDLVRLVVRVVGFGRALRRIGSRLHSAHSLGDRAQQGRGEILGQQPSHSAHPCRPRGRRLALVFGLAHGRLLLALPGPRRPHAFGLLCDFHRGRRNGIDVLLVRGRRGLRGRGARRVHEQVADGRRVEGQGLRARRRRRVEVLALLAATLRLRRTVRDIVLRVLVEQRLHGGSRADPHRDVRRSVVLSAGRDAGEEVHVAESRPHGVPVPPRLGHVRLLPRRSR
mmetsp:Transcript_43998/g.127036  ORF Transcript_43998/g.127036 Transcript_43998/m.127036 type:complete len:238 (-) Transcript_43998:525-1238(-)